MSIYVIADLHLSFGSNKPMDIFGFNWKNHDKKIAEDWNKKVKENDLVVIPGDFSWAMDLKDTKEDFEYLSKLPGRKLILKGNHDYWWNTLTKMRKYLKDNKFEGIDFIQNNYYEFENKIITGTHGWILNGKEDDEKVLRREKLRIKMEIEKIESECGKEKEIIIFMHYPPYEKNIEGIQNPYAELFEDHNIKQCYYGHLHGEQAYADIKDFEFNNVEYKLISADYLDFKLKKIQ